MPHASLPRNPLIAEPLFLARYIEKAGTGTLDMIRLMGAAGLPTPEFRQDGQFVLTLWRDSLTGRTLDLLGLNDRQRKAVAHVRTAGRIGNTEYQRVTGTTKKTASRDLDDLVAKGVMKKTGTTGRGTHYVLARQGDRKGTKGTSDRRRTRRDKGDGKGTKGA